MKKNLLLTIACCLLFTSNLTSCGTDNTNSDNVGEVTEVDPTIPEGDPTSEKVITFWHCLGQDKEEQLNKIVSKFNAEYQGKYKVELFKLAGDYDSLHDAAKTKLSAGEIPALCMGYPDSFSEYMTSTIEESSILRLDNFINDKEVGYSKGEIEDFVPQYLNEGKNYQFSGTWSMPMYKSTEVVYYNENYFAGANLQTENKLKNDSEYQRLRKIVIDQGAQPTEESLSNLKTYTSAHGGYTYDVPVTWDEMVSTSKQMIADLKSENIKDEFYPVGYDSDANMFISQFAQRGIDYTSNDEASKEDVSKHFTFVNDKAKAFVKEVTDLIKEKVLITKNSLGGSKYTNVYFNEAKTAMSIGSTGGSSYNISANFKVGLAPVPYANNNQKYIMQGPSICFFNNDDEFIHKGAWLFYKELAEPTNNAELALENSYDPIRVSSYDTDNYKNWLAKKGQGLKYDIPAITATLKNFYMTSPVFLGSSKARSEIGNLTTYIVNQNLSIDDAFTAAFNACKSAAEAM